MIATVAYGYKIPPHDLLKKYTIKQIMFMYDEFLYLKYGVETDKIDKRDMNHRFIMNDDTGQTQDFVKKECEAGLYNWDEKRKEWYIGKNKR